MVDSRGSGIGKLDVAMIFALEDLISTRSISQAARLAGCSQPTMSHALARMREVFDDPLLVRQGVEMVPTRRGEEILEQIRLLRPHLVALGQPTKFEPYSSDRTFKISATDHASILVIPRLVSRVNAEAPSVRIETFTGPSQQVDVEELTSRFDIRIGWMRTPAMHWHSRQLMEEELILIARAGHPHIHAGMTLDELLEVKFVSIKLESSPGENLIDEQLASLGKARTISATVSHFSMIPSIVADTDLVAMFPKHLLKILGPTRGLQHLDSALPLTTFNLSMLWHPRLHRDPGHRWLRRLIVSCAAEL